MLLVSEKLGMLKRIIKCDKRVVPYLIKYLTKRLTPLADNTILILQDVPIKHVNNINATPNCNMPIDCIKKTGATP